MLNMIFCYKFELFLNRWLFVQVFVARLRVNGFFDRLEKVRDGYVVWNIPNQSLSFTFYSCMQRSITWSKQRKA
ncbi:hypothetical protein RRG08_007032 [Elysia crispata]|uniref:Uncharacterized protein n=1 Tax=Elysia crispata TaxID=231223 RepID=A0AAE0ZJK5_9GAST|nr:hypothetical protein RRG08_007032 [Elysia crispata]